MLYQPRTTNFSPVASARPENPEIAGIGELLARYWRLERAASEIQDEIDQTVAAVLQRIGEDVALAERGDVVIEGTVVDDSWPNQPLVTPKLKTRDDLQRRAAVARHFRLPQKVAAGSAVVEGVRGDELDRLEALDLELAVTRLQIAGAEWEIIERQPRDRNEALAKLRFVSVLMAGDSDIGVEQFAEIVRDCADVIGS